MVRKKFIKVIQSKIGATLLFSFTFIFLFILELNIVGLSLREKITIGSTLDFSWFSDAIERMLHGYILGRDFTFTYGPLFQYIYSLPSLLFHVPSYLSVALSPLVSFLFIFTLVFYITKSLTTNIFEQITFILFLFIILGLLVSNSTDTIKMLIPISFSIILYTTLQKKFLWIRSLVVGMLPTVFGLYAYNLFITCLLFSVVLGIVYLYINRKNWKKNINITLVILLIVIFQGFFSLCFTHNLDYVINSLDSVTSARYVTGLTWTTDRSNILLIFPLSLLFLGWFLCRTETSSKQTRNILLILVLSSIIQLNYVLSRSDAGHLLWATYPSIVTFFSIVLVFGKKIKGLIIIALIFYLFVPFKPTFYNSFSPKNIFKVFQTIREKPTFFNVYKLPENYYYSENEITSIAQISKESKGGVYIYPYDSYILNMEKITFNSFGLGMYVYSHSRVEEETLKGFNKYHPSIIILEIDTKGALSLDDIPNFTRNPTLATWIIKNYRVKQKNAKYLILSYYPSEKKLLKNSCQVHKLTINLNKKENTIERFIDVFKSPLYYFENIRLPYTPSSKSYLIFQDVFNSSSVSSLFEDTQISKEKSFFVNNKDEVAITRVSPFLKRKETKTFNRNEFSFQCVSF